MNAVTLFSRGEREGRVGGVQTDPLAPALRSIAPPEEGVGCRGGGGPRTSYAGAENGGLGGYETYFLGATEKDKKWNSISGFPRRKNWWIFLMSELQRAKRGKTISFLLSRSSFRE